MVNLKSFADWFANLEGFWTLERTVSDGHRLDGNAHFLLLDEKTFELTEQGVLLLPNGAKINASRKWIWKLEAPERLSISYAEKPPRLYHQLDLIRKDLSWKASASHLCSPDVYLGHYLFAEKKLKIDQTVKGPAKDYEVTSNYCLV